MEIGLGFALICAAIGAFAGVMGGLLGIGGGVVMVPAFIRFLGMDARGAIGTSISVIVFIALTAAFKHHREGATQWTVVALVLATSIVGSYLGAAAAHQMPDKTLRLIFAGFLYLVATDMAVRALRI